MSLAGWTLALLLGSFLGLLAGFLTIPFLFFSFGARRLAAGEWIWQHDDVSELGIGVVVLTGIVVGTLVGLSGTAGLQL